MEEGTGGLREEGDGGVPDRGCWKSETQSGTMKGSNETEEEMEK